MNGVIARFTLQDTIDDLTRAAKFTEARYGSYVAASLWMSVERCKILLEKENEMGEETKADAALNVPFESRYTGMSEEQVKDLVDKPFIEGCECNSAEYLDEMFTVGYVKHDGSIRTLRLIDKEGEMHPSTPLFRTKENAQWYIDNCARHNDDMRIISLYHMHYGGKYRNPPENKLQGA